MGSALSDPPAAPGGRGMRLRLRAPAKVNLALEVLGKRSDGFHELVTVVHAIGLYDELEVEAAPRLSVELCGARVSAEEDLVLRAARALRDRLAPGAGAHIVCKKQIPLAAGLGGGSSDAAA